MGDDTFELDVNVAVSKRRLLGALGVIGGSAAATGGTLALLSDEESFGTAENPNVIRAGEVDLSVDWRVVHFGPGEPQTIASQPTPVDRPGPIVEVVDLKPGDVIQKQLSTHLDGNPAFLTFDATVVADEDNGINEPEDAVDGTYDGADGTPGGDLAEHLNCVVWYDGFEAADGSTGGTGATPGNGRPDEGIWTASGSPTDDGDFESALQAAQSPSDAFDTTSPLVLASGTVADLAGLSAPLLLDSRTQGDTPDSFDTSACYDAGGVQYLGCVCWLPRDVAGIDDNLLQTDRLEYEFGFNAVQCRNNVAEDGTPRSLDVVTDPDDDGGPTVPRTQVDKIRGSAVSTDDTFGTSVSLDGDTVLAGAPLADNSNGAVAGDAYVFTETGSGWSEQARLLAQDSGADAGDTFGSAVALDGDTALIGADIDEDPNGTDAGSAYVFTRLGSSWTQQAKLAAQDSGADAEDTFGSAVALDGDTALIGADDDEDPNGTGAGSAYVFTRSGGAWTQQAKLTAQDTGADADDAFGTSVALDGDTALVGASGDEDPNGFQAGSAYVFTRSGSSWTQQAKLAAQDSGADADDRFGTAVALDGDTALIGAYRDEDPNGADAGSAYVFTRAGSNWTQQAKLTAQDSGADMEDFFGTAVALDGDAALVGASGDEDPNGTDAGSAYVFTRSGSNWTQQVKLAGQDADADSNDTFGFAVALDGGTALIGAPGDEGSFPAFGSAYVFGP